MAESMAAIPAYASIMQAAIIHATHNLALFGNVERAFLSGLSYELTQLPIWYVELHFSAYDRAVTVTVSLLTDDSLRVDYLSEGFAATVEQVVEAHRQHIVLLERGQEASRTPPGVPWVR
ncbi:MAG: hypothetical protein H0T73_04130 [Ardenticatenales bacterium]|nr:hypothetical protein [Ardenticatenales bacterium]